MNSLTITCLAVAALLLPGSLNSSRAQGIGYAQAIDRLGTSRGKDIEKFCKKANLGGGRVTQYPDQSSCKAGATEMTVLVTTRAQARAASWASVTWTLGGFVLAFS